MSQYKSNNQGFTWSPEILKEIESEEVAERAEGQAEAGGIHDNSRFYMGIRDCFTLEESEDVVVIGKLFGALSVGDKIYITNLGDDAPETKEAQVKGLELKGGLTVGRAENGMVGVLVSGKVKGFLRVGSVLSSSNVVPGEIRQAYISSLGDKFVVRKDLEISEEELKSLSIADCAEIWRLHTMYVMKKRDELTEEKKEDYRERLYNLCCALCDKILTADSIYTVLSRATGEPYMFSRVVEQDDKVACTVPEILLIPRAYKEMVAGDFPKERFEFYEIQNGEDKKGIAEYLEDAFYINGAGGVRVVGEPVVIAAPTLVEKPDYEDVPREMIPLTNPDLMRWLLMLGQLGRPENEEQQKIYNLYFRFLFKEILKANFLIPSKEDLSEYPLDETGKTVLPSDKRVTFAVVEGKDGRKAVRFFTDTKKLKSIMGEDCNSFIRPIEPLFENLDCVINASGNCAASVYLTREMIESMKDLIK